MVVPRIKARVWLAVAAAVAVIASSAAWKHGRSGVTVISGTDAIAIPLASIRPGEARFFAYHGRAAARFG